jgi:hypothetical protein
MKLQLITRQSRANGAANRWKNIYFDNEGWRHIMHGSSEEIYNKLAILSEPVDPDKVDQIIGNGSWTRVKCDNCGKVASVVTVGQEPDYESSTANVCQDCLRNALAKFDEEIS